MSEHLKIQDQDGTILCECDNGNKAAWIVDTLNERYPGRFSICPENVDAVETF